MKNPPQPPFNKGGRNRRYKEGSKRELYRGRRIWKRGRSIKYFLNP